MEENMEKNIEAIEQERREYEEGLESGKVEEQEVEEMEFSLTENEIQELILKLQLLKETKEPFTFDVDDENSFVIHYEEDGE